MKSCSYTTLLLATTVLLGCVFAFFIWRDEVHQTTFLAKQTVRALFVASLVLGLCLSGSIKKWGKGKQIHGVTDNIKLVAGTVLVAYFIIYALLITLTWMLPGKMSTYTSSYEYSARSRNSCSGVDVDDPDLKRQIKVCEPAGNYYYRGNIRVTKRSNVLGMTVVYATTEY
ncbi:MULTISPECIES: hypothetical protein [unclassified Pantoea]|uniref:hypothetical protein n=1 Tax=unclassified Pantoea TaxID=2630326 RepID=UPI00301B73E2